jgi:hypothetical protein
MLKMRWWSKSESLTCVDPIMEAETGSVCADLCAFLMCECDGCDDETDYEILIDTYIPFSSLFNIPTVILMST